MSNAVRSWQRCLASSRTGTLRYGYSGDEESDADDVLATVKPAPGKLFDDLRGMPETMTSFHVGGDIALERWPEQERETLYSTKIAIQAFTILYYTIQ